MNTSSCTVSYEIVHHKKICKNMFILVHCICILYWTLHFLYCITLCSWHTLYYGIHSLLHSVQCIIHYILYISQCSTLYTALYIMYSIPFDFVHCTVHHFLHTPLIIYSTHVCLYILMLGKCSSVLLITVRKNTAGF